MTDTDLEREDIEDYAHYTKRDLKEAEILWVKEAQNGLIKKEWKIQFQLYEDERGIWRCYGRLGNADLPFNARHPILLPRSHYFTELVVLKSHTRVSHSGVKDTLTEIRSKYWIPGGRSLVRRLIHKCVICRRFNAPHYRPPPPPPLSDYRVRGGVAFQSIGVDYAGPVTIRHYAYTSHHSNSHTKRKGVQNAHTSHEGKAWVCLFTCCTSRAVHLDVVIDLTARSFLRCFKLVEDYHRASYQTRLQLKLFRRFSANRRSGDSCLTAILPGPLMWNGPLGGEGSSRGSFNH